MCRVLERSGLGGNDDVAHQTEFGMALCGPVDDADHGYLDIEEPSHQTLGIPMHPIEPQRGYGRAPFLINGDLRVDPGPDEVITRAGENDDPVAPVGADLGESLCQLALCDEIPLQRAAIA